jgi:hypothetical protein
VYRSAELSSTVSSADRGPFQLFEEILFTPPRGSAARPGDRYLAYEIGPHVEGLGQLMVPTGVIEVVRSPQRDVAGVARVVRLYRRMREPDRLIPFDPTLAIVSGRPRRMLPQGAQVARVRWVVNEPVLPSLQSYLVIDLSSRNGVRVGDEFTLFEPARSGQEGEPRLPESAMGVAQVVRSTPHGATLIVLANTQPAIRVGVRARMSAKTP